MNNENRGLHQKYIVLKKEYIEREALNKVIDYEKEVCNSGIAKGVLEMLKVRVEPAADVVEVVHGRWEYVTRRYEAWTHRCSECGEIMTTQIGRQANYCHNCGAKMDKEE